MSSTILKLMLLLGIIGHAYNMYCDRILSIFPNGQLKLENFKDLTNAKKMAHLLERGIPKDSHVFCHPWCFFPVSAVSRIFFTECLHV